MRPSLRTKIILLFSVLCLIRCQEKVCQLTGQGNADPFPSLVKCYKYNKDSCCTSVHDDYIHSFISNLLTPACARKYGELEDLFCYGCSPKEYVYTNSQEKKIKICKSFIKMLWNSTTDEDLNKPTTRFDNCGFKINSDSPVRLKELTDKPYLIPSHSIRNIQDFMDRVGIPFFQGYTLDIIDDTNLTDLSEVCYLSSDFIPIAEKIILLIFMLIVVG